MCDGWMGVGVAVPLGAPDALVQTGSARFAAHARLLAAHSGYFKSVLGTRRDAVLYVPNVSAQQFWPLLAYMYTGYLDLSPDNIYQVLLATHLLHMPRALDLCRNFLAQTRPPPPLPPTIVKPIPSRKLPPFLSSNVFRPLGADSLVLPSPVNETSFRTPDSFGDKVQVAQDLKLTSTSEECSNAKDTEFSHDSGSSYISVGNDPRKSEDTSSLKNDKVPTVNKLSVDSDVEARDDVKFKSKPEESSHSKINLQSDDKVVIDIACCDGPVRFHRVLNRAYKNNCPDKFKDVAELTDSDDSYIEIEEDTRSKGGENVPYDNCNAFSKSLQKQMTENIKLQNENRPEGSINGEASQSVVDGNNPEQTSNPQQDTIYTCVYCNHTFKSQYCYQKHARRHLNPVSIDAVNQEGLEGCFKARPVAQKVQQTAGPRREVRLLDMNVQYYPCKTCGSKFPSYYFVHKHRKMCHADELEGSEGNVKGNSIPDKKRKMSSNKDAKSSLERNDGCSKVDV